jgi:hypothetical protein
MNLWEGTNMPRGAPDGSISLKDLKDCLDALEKLKAIRRELKVKLSKEGLSDQEELDLASHLAKISKSIKNLETMKLRELSQAGNQP